jgi:hypothetical protein
MIWISLSSLPLSVVMKCHVLLDGRIEIHVKSLPWSERRKHGLVERRQILPTIACRSDDLQPFFVRNEWSSNCKKLCIISLNHLQRWHWVTASHWACALLRWIIQMDNIQPTAAVQFTKWKVGMSERQKVTHFPLFPLKRNKMKQICMYAHMCIHMCVHVSLGEGRWESEVEFSYTFPTAMHGRPLSRWMMVTRGVSTSMQYGSSWNLFGISKQMEPFSLSQAERNPSRVLLVLTSITSTPYLHRTN